MQVKRLEAQVKILSDEIHNLEVVIDKKQFDELQAKNGAAHACKALADNPTSTPNKKRGKKTGNAASQA